LRAARGLTIHRSLIGENICTQEEYKTIIAGGNEKMEASIAMDDMEESAKEARL
jgi:hypothetical protein